MEESWGGTQWRFGMKHRAPVLNAAILVLVFAVAVAAQSTEIEQLRLAAEQGDASAQFNLGFMYATGEGVPKDDAKAVKWFRLAAEQGHAQAQYNLGFMYADGRGVLKDRILAHIWFNIAGANGHAQAHEIRDTVERELTRAEVTRATELARACMDSDYQSCEP